VKQFEILVPPGWVMFDLRDEIKPQVAAFVRQRVSRHSRADSVRPLLTEALTKTATELADGGAVAMTVAIEPPDGLSGSPISIFMPLAVPEDKEPLDLLLAVASSDPSAQAIDVGDLVAIRLSATSDATAAVGDAVAEAATLMADDGVNLGAGFTAQRLTVRYLMGDPGDRERWADVSFSVTGTSRSGSAEIAAALVELFDATIQTFRWLP